MNTKRTTTQRLASLLLEQDVLGWVQQQRVDGHTWRAIARTLNEQTHGQVDVTHEAIRQWIQDTPA